MCARMYVQQRTPFPSIYIAAFPRGTPRLYISQSRARRFDLRITPVTTGAYKPGRALEFRLPVGQLFAGRFLRCKYPAAADWRFAVIPIYEPTISACSCTGFVAPQSRLFIIAGIFAKLIPGNFGSARSTRRVAFYKIFLMSHNASTASLDSI